MSLRRRSGDDRGASLVDLVIALAMFVFLATSILSVWGYGQRGYFLGSEIAELQGDARVALDQMARDIRKAGRDVLQCAFDSDAYTDCSGAKLTRCRTLLGNPTFTCNNVWIIPAATTTSLQIQMDLNGDAAIDTSTTSEESISYAFNAGTRLITRRQGTGPLAPLAENIDSLTFAYEGQLPSGGGCTGAWGAITPNNQTARDCIQRVTIMVVARGQVGQDLVRRSYRTSVDLPAR